MATSKSQNHTSSSSGKYYPMPPQGPSSSCIIVGSKRKYMNEDPGAPSVRAPRARSNNSSSSKPELNGRYDIFLSFRGSDTRKKFTDHLYHALMHEGFQTFGDDDEIERGEVIKSELDKAIKNSTMSVIVLSQNYANSTACLFELQTILELCKNSDHFVLPVFYEVEPQELKDQSKNLVFEKKEVTPEKVKGWSAALKEVASMAGVVSGKESNG